jgi:hypothetical protein
MADRNQPRAIVAKFNNFKQRQDVKFKSRQLKGTKYYINEQFPSEINEQRRLLINFAKKKQRQGHTTPLVYNKLYVDGTLYKPPTYPQVHEQTKYETAGIGQSLRIAAWNVNRKLQQKLCDRDFCAVIADYDIIPVAVA